MGKTRRHCGFSLVEVLLAVGTLAIGMIFIGGTYLVGVHLAGVSAERTTATIVANEAFAKIEIFRVNPADCAYNRQTPFERLLSQPLVGPRAARGPMNPDEFAYPSTRTLANKQYFWSALGRLDPNDPSGNTLVLTVFVSRKVGNTTLYPYRHPTNPMITTIGRPVAMPVEVQGVAGGNVLTLVDDPATAFDETRWIGPGYTIIEDSKGHKYRVVRHGNNPAVPEIVLDKPWNPDGLYPNPDIVWVVPPPLGRGKGPCIEVYQQGGITF